MENFFFYAVSLCNFQFQVASLAETNPSLKTKIKFWASGKWATFSAKYPKTANVATKIKNLIKLPFVSRNPYWVGFKATVAFGAKAGLSIFLVGK